MSQAVRNRVMVEPLEHRTLMADVSAFANVDFLVNGSAFQRPDSTRIVGDQLLLEYADGRVESLPVIKTPSVKLGRDGIVRTEFNGWEPGKVAASGKGMYTLTFRLSLPKAGGPLPFSSNRDTNFVRSAMMRGTDDPSTPVELTYFIPADGVRRILWPRAADSKYPPAPIGQTPSDPAPGVYDDTQKGWEKKLKQQIKDADDSSATLAFFGDSHVERYMYYGRRSWNSYFADALNLGTSGDGTRQLLERIEAGLFDDFKPKTLVMLFGTNNFNDPATGGTDAQIAAGIQAVVRSLRKRLPDTKFVMVGMFPRNSPERNDRIQHVNDMTADFARREGIAYLDIYDHFTGDPIRRAMYSDETHLNATGYRLLTNYLVPLI